MKRRMLLGVVTAIAIAVLAGASVATADERDHDDDDDGDEVHGVYVALGDSLAVGTGARNGARQGYVARVSRFASFGGDDDDDDDERGALANLAVGGETSGTFLSDGQLAAALAAIEDPDSDTQLVTLVIDGDDLLPLLRQAPCATDPAGAACQGIVGARLIGFAGNLPTILGCLQAALAADPGDERLLVMTYYNPFSGTGSPFEAPVDGVLLGADGVIDCAATVVDPRNSGLNDIISCIGGAAGATVVDVYPAFEGRGAELTHIAAGDVHPNNRGHRVIAAQHRRVLR